MTGFLKQISPSGPTIAFQYDPEQCEPTGGLNGWQPVSRPRRLSGTEYVGNALFTLPINLVYDGLVDGRSIESIISQFYSWGQPVAPGKEPPVLQLGYGVFTKLRWVMNDVNVSSTIRRADGQRVQAQIALTLLEYQGLTPKTTAADSVRSAIISTNAAVGQTENNPVTKTYTVVKGDTLQKIAARYLGNSSLWQKIATLNGIKDPLHLKVGTKLKLPPK